MGKKRKLLLLLGFVLTVYLDLGCGYSFQNSHNPLAAKEGVQKIYISPLANNTFKGGIENVVYNNLLRTLVAHARVTVVYDVKEADAILEGSISSAAFNASAATGVVSLNPGGLASRYQLPSAPYSVATEYTALLACSFALNRTQVSKGKSKLVWTSSFSRSKPFPASNQLDVPGTTSSLINDSEFDRALADLAKSMMDDLHESMLAIF
jgi:hypothetical protein